MTDHELLVLRTAALDRVVAQLDEIRAIHRPRPIDGTSGLLVCRACPGLTIYPCPTARAAGIRPETYPHNKQVPA